MFVAETVTVRPDTNARRCPYKRDQDEGGGLEALGEEARLRPVLAAVGGSICGVGQHSSCVVESTP